MKIPTLPGMNVVAVAVAFALLSACSSAPTRPDGSANLRSRLTALQGNPDFASRAPLAIKDAETAVVAAEKPQADKVLGAHLVFLADRKINTAEALAQSRLAVDQRKTLESDREAMRLQARTQEADAANRRATVAQADANTQRRDAETARGEADAARGEADAARSSAREASAEAERNAQELARQIAELEAKETDRGLVLTLGDVLFTTGTANLNEGISNHLEKLATFLAQHPERTVLIEGHTDSMGSDAYNQGLSERRADAVKAWLIRKDIAASRLTASGKGEGEPIGDNASATGRQQNRRVEVIIQNSLVSAR